MTIQALTPEDLNTRLLSFIDSSRVLSFPKFHLIYSILYDHGLRVQELFDITRFELQADDDVVVSTSKGSNPRVIKLQDFPPDFQINIITQSNQATNFSYSTLERFFQDNIVGKSFSTGAKSLGTHLFRHNRIKQDTLSGLSQAALLVKYGFKNQATLEGYQNSLIFHQSY